MNLKKTLPAVLLTLALLATMGIAVADEDQPQPKTRLRDAIGQEENPQGHLRQNRPGVGWDDVLANAVEVSPGVFYLGKANDKGKVVEGYAFLIKDKKRFAKPRTVCGNGICEPRENARKCPEDCGGEDPEDPDTNSCYDFLAKEAKWKTVEDYIVDPSNTKSLNENFIRSNLASDITKWETAAGVDILGDEDTTKTVNRATIGSLNGENEVMFADINSPGAIGVTIIWGTFSAPKPFRKLVEWDMIFDDADFYWSSTGESDKMDFENIATHELGHAVGMGDLYTDLCSEQTMYGYANNGETKKRTLEAGDIAGLNILYN